MTTTLVNTATDQIDEYIDFDNTESNTLQEWDVNESTVWLDSQEFSVEETEEYAPIIQAIFTIHSPITHQDYLTVGSVQINQTTLKAQCYKKDCHWDHILDDSSLDQMENGTLEVLAHLGTHNTQEFPHILRVNWGHDSDDDRMMDHIQRCTDTRCNHNTFPPF